MRVMGIDPASRVTGIAIIDDGRLVDSSVIAVRAPSGRRSPETTWRRLQEMAARVHTQVVGWHPDIVAIEVTRPVSYMDAPRLKTRRNLKDLKGRRGIDNVIVYKQAMGAIAAAVGLAVRDTAIILHLDVEDWKHKKSKFETLFEASHLYDVPLAMERRYDQDRADAIMIAHTAWCAYELAKDVRMDFLAYCIHTYRHSQVWVRTMMESADGRGEGGGSAR